MGAPGAGLTGLTGLLLLQTLACGANTSFSVVYLGRREGPVAAHLYIHTSLGVHKYPVRHLTVRSAKEAVYRF